MNVCSFINARLEKHPSIQLNCVGPVIDLYGRFAAEKLARLMEMYPNRVYSKPEFTTSPPYGGLGLMPGWVSLHSFFLMFCNLTLNTVVPCRIEFNSTHVVPAYENNKNGA